MPPPSSALSLRQLIDAPDAAGAVRAAPAAPLYYAIQEVGLADATDVVQLASPEQFRAFVDLGAWRKDKLDPSELLTWLRAARGEEPADFLAKLHGVDLELLELLVRRYATIHDLEENPDVHPAGSTMETPEGRYLIEIHAEGVELSALRQLFTDLIAENPFESTRLLEAIRWEIPSELEETAHQFRAARLADLGFPALEDALALFARVEVPAPPASPPAQAALARTERVDYVAAALARLEGAEPDNAEAELLALANAVLVAEVSDPGDLEAVRRAGGMARDYLNLGFEALTGADPARAAEVLRSTPFRRIFQVGFSLTLKLKFRADALMKEPLARVEGRALLLDEEARALVALRRKRPLRALKVEGAEPVSFRDRKELDEAEGLLSRAESQLPVLRALLGPTEAQVRAHAERCADPVYPATAERMLAAAAANALLEGKAEVAAVSSARLPALVSKALRPGAGEEATAVLAAATACPPGQVRPLVDRILARWVSELGPAYQREGTVLPIAAELVPVAAAD